MAETVQDPNQPSSEEIQQAIKQVATSAALEEKNLPIEVKTATGRVYRGATGQDLINELVRAQENADRKILEQNQELERIKQERVQAEQQVHAPAAENEYSSDTAYKLFAEDPRKFKEYMDRFDPKTQEIDQTIQGMRRQSEIDRFKANVGFTPTQEEALAFGQEFSNARLEPTANNFELVFRRMVDNGKLRPAAASIQGQRPPVPGMGAGGRTEPSTGIDMRDFEQLPAEKQKEVIDRLAAMGYR